MNIFGLEIGLAKKAQGMSIDTLMQRFAAQYETFSGVAITPETAMQSPTVNSIVTGISRRISTLPIKVMRKVVQEGNDRRTRKEELPSHPVANLLKAPNRWQDRNAFWLDATSWLVRYGNAYYFKSRGQTGPIRELIPLHPSCVAIHQDTDSLDVVYRVTSAGGRYVEYEPAQILHARLGARDGIKGDSPIIDIREAIALEITAERMAGSVFGNAAMPSMVFKHGPTSLGFKTNEEEKRFIDDFQKVYANRGRFKSMILPKGMELDQVPVDNDKAQFLATRQYQRTVIAGALGYPPHMAGDMSKASYSNVEQTSLDFIMNVVLPYVRIFEAAMERALLTDEDRRSGVIIRFNLDGALRGDFLSRQQGLKIQREAGVINANDWREAEDKNPISSEDGGDEFWRQGPSGQSATAEQPETPPTDQPAEDQSEDDNDA